MKLLDIHEGDAKLHVHQSEANPTYACELFSYILCKQRRNSDAVFDLLTNGSEKVVKPKKKKLKKNVGRGQPSFLSPAAP